MNIRETPKGYALDLGTLYAYSNGEHVGFWWSETKENTAFKSAEAVREFFVARLADLEAAALKNPQYARGGRLPSSYPDHAV